MRPVIWSPKALRANRKLIAYLTQRSEETGARLVHDRILAAADKLGEVLAGRPGRWAGTYEKSVPRTSHIILYAIRRRESREYVIIMDVVHMSRNWRRGEPPPSD